MYTSTTKRYLLVWISYMISSESTAVLSLLLPFPRSAL